MSDAHARVRVVGALVIVAAGLTAIGLRARSCQSSPSSPTTLEVAAPPDDAETRELRAALGEQAGGLTVLVERDGRRVYGVATAPDEASARWEALRALVARTQRWPVLMAGTGRMFEMLEVAPGPVDEALERARGLDVEAWIAARERELGLAGLAAPTGEWPVRGGVLGDPLAASSPMIGGALASAAMIALVPTPDGSEAPVWLAFGGWNDCPEPAVHVALLRRWRARYGAEIRGMSDDSLELVVAGPPADREAAMVVAREHFAYDTDLVWQGAESVEALGASLVGSRYWFFWWD